MVTYIPITPEIQSTSIMNDVTMLEPGSANALKISGTVLSPTDELNALGVYQKRIDDQTKAREAPKPVVLSIEEEKKKRDLEEKAATAYRHRKHLRLPKVNLKKKKSIDKKVIRGLNTKIKPEIPGINIRELGIIHTKSKNDNVVAKVDINKINEVFKTPSIVMDVMGTKNKSIMGIGLNKINKSVKVAAKFNINVLGKKRKIKGR
jgi:hypothetical protein